MVYRQVNPYFQGIDYSNLKQFFPKSKIRGIMAQLSLWGKYTRDTKPYKDNKRKEN